MSNPFVSTSVVGYNANPPPDDGSTTAANEILWATIKTKLPDPLKTALESINTNVAAAISALAGGITTTAISYAIQASDQGKIVKATVAGITISADATARGTPFRVTIVNLSSGDITFDPTGSQTIDGVATLTIPKTRGIVIDTDGTNWVSQGKNWHPELIPNPFSLPKGRLTLVTATPILTSDQTAKTTVFYTPYQGNTIMLPDANGDWALYQFSEVSQTLADNTKSPAATTANNNYDYFGWLDGTTFRVTRGPAWSSATTRGTGAGTSELTLLDGALVNANAISNGPGASLGLFLGTIRTNGSNQVEMVFGPASNSTGNNLFLWNYYNRIDIFSFAFDSTDTWDYTTATWRGTNGNTIQRFNVVVGVNEDRLECSYQAYVKGTTNGNGATCGVGLDSTSALASGCTPGFFSAISATVAPQTIRATLVGLLGLGSHFLQALERSTAAGTTSWFGDNGDQTTYQAAIFLKLKM